MQDRWFIINDFSKGINKAVSDHLLQDNEAAWQKNVYLGLRHQGYGGRGALQKRPGSKEYPQQFTERNNIHGLAVYRMADGNDDNHDYLYAAKDKKLYFTAKGLLKLTEIKAESDNDDFNQNESRVGFETIKNKLVLSGAIGDLKYVDPTEDPIKIRRVGITRPPRVTNGTTIGRSETVGSGFGLDSGTYRYRLAFRDTLTNFISAVSPYVEVTVAATQNCVSFQINEPKYIFPQPVHTDNAAHALYRTAANETSTYYLHSLAPFDGETLITYNTPGYVLDYAGDAGSPGLYPPLRERPVMNENEEDIDFTKIKGLLAYSDRLHFVIDSDWYYSERGEPFKFLYQGIPNFVRVTSKGNDLIATAATRNGILLMAKSSIYIGNTDPPSLRLLDSNVGIVGEFARASDGNYAYFLGNDNKIYKSDGVNIQAISALIENELRFLDKDDWEQVSLEIFDDMLFVNVGGEGAGQYPLDIGVSTYVEDEEGNPINE